MKHIKFDQYTRLYFVKNRLSPRFRSRIRRWCSEVTSPLEVSEICRTSSHIRRNTDIEFEAVSGQETAGAGEFFMWFCAHQPGCIVLHATGDRLALMKDAHAFILALAERHERRGDVLGRLFQTQKKIELASGV